MDGDKLNEHRQECKMKAVIVDQPGGAEGGYSKCWWWQVRSKYYRLVVNHTL